MSAHRGNLPTAPFRWPLGAVEREFKLAGETIKRRLEAAGEKAGEDGCFSTEQLLRSIYGSLENERIRETSARADHWQLRVRALKGELLDREALELGLGSVFVAIRQILESAPGLPRTTKADILSAISATPVVIKGVAARQVRQLRGEKQPKKEESEKAAA